MKPLDYIIIALVMAMLIYAGIKTVKNRGKCPGCNACSKNCHTCKTCKK